MRSLGTSRTSFNIHAVDGDVGDVGCSNIRIIGVPEGEEEEQQIKNLFEQIMKENFPSLAKEIDFQEVQEAQRIPKKLDPRKHT